MKIKERIKHWKHKGLLFMTKKLQILMLAGCCLFLNACSNNHQYFSNDDYTAGDYNQLQAEAQQRRAADHRAYVALAESASSVSQSLTHLAQTEQAAHPPMSVSTPPSPASYGMGMRASINWNGPVKPVVQQLANAANYKLKVLGKEPPIPVIVSVSAKNAAVGNILRDIGYQSKKRAQIVVFPSKHTIELRYADS
jgi:defect-in-organelle-trafficking protein DotD